MANPPPSFFDDKYISGHPTSAANANPQAIALGATPIGNNFETAKGNNIDVKIDEQRYGKSKPFRVVTRGRIIRE